MPAQTQFFFFFSQFLSTFIMGDKLSMSLDSVINDSKTANKAKRGGRGGNRGGNAGGDRRPVKVNRVGGGHNNNNGGGNRGQQGRSRGGARVGGGAIRKPQRFAEGTFQFFFFFFNDKENSNVRNLRSFTIGASSNVGTIINTPGRIRAGNSRPFQVFFFLYFFFSFFL